MADKKKTGGDSSSLNITSMPHCGNCGAAVVRIDDVYCRKCGTRQHLSCSKCGKYVKPGDKYCPNCGRTRWYWLELWRNGALLEQSTVAKVAVVVGVAAAWLGLYHLVRTRMLHH